MYVHDPNANPVGAVDPLVRPGHFGEQPRRSAIPRVVGILAIIFASFGLLGTLGITFGGEDDLKRLDVTRQLLGSFGTWVYVAGGLGVLLFAIHLTAGIQAVRYAPSAPRWMTIYGVFALVLLAADVGISMATFPEGQGFLRRALYEHFVYPRIGLAVLALPWPIVALALINQRSARLSCGALRD
jgi:hypothetical protein